MGLKVRAVGIRKYLWSAGDEKAVHTRGAALERRDLERSEPILGVEPVGVAPLREQLVEGGLLTTRSSVVPGWPKAVIWWRRLLEPPRGAWP